MTRWVSLKAFAAGVAISAVLGAAGPLAAQEFRHGLSTFGDLKYPADFKHFDYVNPAAPKGGRFSTYGGPLNSFDTFNPFILKGDAATGLGLLFDTLMARSGDEPDAMYGLVAKDVAIAPDKMSVTFRLRPAAKFSDGSQITADDVVFSFDTLKSKGHPSYRIMMRDVTKGEALDAQTVRFTFTGELVRDLPTTVAGLPVLSKKYYATREFDQTTLEPPLGSGPYLIASDYKPGSQITYKRRADYWAKDLPVNVGTNNFDEIRYEYYRDRTPALEGFKAGTYDFREEFTARDWSTNYVFPAVKEGRVKLTTLPDANPSGAQGFFFNTRRAKFADPRVRKALDYAFDYEFANKNLFYGLYTRTNSYFENSDMKAVGKPSPEELALLEPFRAKLPPAVFEEPYMSPVSDGSGTDRKLLREAARLLDEAGCKIKDKVRVCPSGEKLEFEFLMYEASFERIIAPYVKNLQAIGVNATMRRVDSAQYQRRVKTFDFDVVTQRFVMRLTPGMEMRNYWASENAGIEGSVNLAGIKDPVIDALLDKVVEAKSRAELVTATRAIDRVLRAGHYWVPQWYKAAHNIGYWDKFGFPATKPKYSRGVPDTWWYDAAKDAKLKQN
jgi:microcin C transport system substrate-binding protein